MKNDNQTCGLSVAHQCRADFIRILELILEELTVKRVFCSSRLPQRNGPMSFSPYARIDVVLSGRKRMLYAAGGEEQEAIMYPGDIHYDPPLCWKQPEWDLLHEMSSIVYNTEYIHITYIDYRTRSDEYINHAPAKIFYDTALPLNEAGNAVLHALNFQAERNNPVGVRELTTALIRLTLDQLRNDSPLPRTKARNTWYGLNRYLRENFRSPINRNEVATLFKLNPSYVSRLFQSEGGESFNTVLRRYRLEHAALLLRNTDMTIDEITESCGYRSSTFFIAVFKRFYGRTPGSFRRKE